MFPQGIATSSGSKGSPEKEYSANTSALVDAFLHTEPADFTVSSDPRSYLFDQEVTYFQ